MARPSLFTHELFTAILGRIMEGESLRAICRDDGMPDRSTVSRWLVEDAERQRAYALATDIRADMVFDEVLEIADDASRDWLAKYGEKLDLNHGVQDSLGDFLAALDGKTRGIPNPSGR